MIVNCNVCQVAQKELDNFYLKSIATYEKAKSEINKRN